MKRTVRQVGVNRKTRNQRITPRNRRKPNIKLLAGLFAISACAGCICSYLLQAPALVIRQVEVRGIHYADRAQVQQAAKAVLGKNIILLRKGPIIDRIDDVHEVAGVRMGRTPPNRIWIKITERRAGAVLAYGGKCFLLQDDGLAFHETSPKAVCRDASGSGARRPIPIVRVAGCAPVREGCRCASQGVGCALEIAKIARQRRLDVEKISVDRLGDICLNMGSGFYVKLGQPDELAKKMSLLQDALVYKPSLAREAAYIDLSCPTAPVWKPRNGVGPAS